MREGSQDPPLFLLPSAGRGRAPGARILSIGTFHNFSGRDLCNLTKNFFPKTLDFYSSMCYNKYVPKREQQKNHQAKKIKKVKKSA